MLNGVWDREYGIDGGMDGGGAYVRYIKLWRKK